MQKSFTWGGMSLGLFAALALIVGCSQSDNKGGQAKDAGGKGTQVAKADEKKEGDSKHSGWWCDEHGVPEAECSMCSAKVAKAFKDKGDWCSEHERAKSQCFICDPSLRERYAANYRAKYGKEPPEPTENMPKKDDKKDKK